MPDPESRRVADFLRATFDTIDQGITIYDADLRLVAWNEQYERMKLFPDKFVKYGVSLLDAYWELAHDGAFGPGDPEKIYDEHTRALREGPLIEEELLTSQEGRTLRIRRFALPEGGVCATFADVTDELRMEQQLRQAQKLDALGRLTGGVAHDFNNVLAVVLGNLELVLEDPSHPQAVELLRSALQSAERAAKLTSRLLTFARSQPLSTELVRADVAIGSLMGMLRTLLGGTIEIDFSSEPELWPVEVDLNQLEHALVNVTLNARDAMDGRGRVTLEARNTVVDDGLARREHIDAGEYVTITCTDNGSGMDETTMDHAFEPFFTTKEADSGTGLGLSMVHGFATQSKGFVRLASQVDSGTTVTLYIPRSNKPAHVATSPDEATDGPDAEPNDRHVLLVDDDHLIRGSLEAQLRASGYEVTSVDSAAAALALLVDGHPYHLMLTDVVMPGGMNGRDLAGKAKILDPAMPVVFMSGYSQAILSDSDLAEGSFLQKPFTRTQLVDAIEELLDR